jgi:hypothetical protein
VFFELFDDGYTAAVLEVSLREFPRIVVCLKLLVKVGARLIDQIVGDFHDSVEALNESNIVCFWIELHELDDGVWTLLVAALREIEAALASAFGRGRDTVNAKVESHEWFPLVDILIIPRGEIQNHPIVPLSALAQGSPTTSPATG